MALTPSEADWRQRLERLTHRCQRIDVEAARQPNDRRQLLLLRHDLLALIAELEDERTLAAGRLAAVTTGGAASLAYLRVGRTIAAAVPAYRPVRDIDHVHRH